ncbi:MAG TPA: proprotein convertase P-domain-containing protein [Phycisphaerae bacterium]|nr:proprotein convertase P-domain-containing protein [Phycisphaerae bacterium]
MYQRQNTFFTAALAFCGALIAANDAPASEVFYSTCPGYPVSVCPPTWSEVNIPDNNANGVTIQLDVPPDGEYFITDVNPWFYISHTWQGDLRVVLTSPAGTNVDLVNRAGSPACGNGFGFEADNFGRINPDFFLVQGFDLDDSAASIYTSPPVACPGVNDENGVWRPVSPLSAFNGQSKVGPWKLFIQDLAVGDVGTVHVWGMTIRTEPATPPVADIALPDDYACGCAGGPVTGTARDPDGTFSGYTLEWSVDSAGPWTTIAASGTAVDNGQLGTFPANMPEGHSYVRLIATNALGMSSTFIKVIHQDRTFGGAGILDPVDGDIVGGSVCTDLISASDYCFASAALAYAPSGGSFTTFFSTSSPVQEFPPWNTNGLANGNYTLRVTGTTTCGHTASDDVAVVIDNTAPVALITSPDNCDPMSGVVPILGTVTDAHLSGWTLQYTGGAVNDWQTIATGTNPVSNGLLANWNTSGLPACGYTLRLVASDASIVSCLGSNSTEYLVSVEIGGGTGGGSCDVNGDSAVDAADIQPLVDCLVGP